jgi:hypothetical protein
MASTSLVTIGKSIKSTFNHSASVVADSSATSPASIVDLVKIICLRDLHETAAPPIVNIYPLMALISSSFEIQLESLYPSSIASPYVDIPLNYLITHSRHTSDRFLGWK